MPSLREVQHAMRRSLLQEGDEGDDMAAGLIVSADWAPGQRLDIYRNTLLGACANALRLSFPAVQRLVGADFFDGAARIFALAQPPRRADLNAYGGEFPSFLERFEPAAGLVYLADVARLDWAVNRALHAPDADPLAPQRLAAIAPADHGRVCFVAHPSVSTLRSAWPVDHVWQAVLARDDAALAAIDLQDGPACLLVQRVAGEVEVARLALDAWRLADELLRGRPLGAALGAASGLDAAAELAAHLAAGRFVAFDLADTDEATGDEATADESLRSDTP